MGRTRTAKDKRERIKKARKKDFRVVPTRIVYMENLQSLLNSGYVDIRTVDHKCKYCEKICVNYEKEGPIRPNETFCYHRIYPGNRFTWYTSCIECNLKHNKRQRAQRSPFNKITKHLAEMMERHVDGTPVQRKQLLFEIRDKHNGKCKSCGVHVIQAMKSGWRQESINDMNPNEWEKATYPYNNLTISCLGCNYAQNKLGWNDYMSMLHTISNVVCEPKNMQKLNKQEMFWFLYRTSTQKDGCPISVKKQLFERDGRYCVVTGVEMIFASNHWNTVSFDRINSKLPYTVDNTRLVCKHINYVKAKSITESELQDWLAHIRIMYCPPDRFFQSVEFAHRKKRKIDLLPPN